MVLPALAAQGISFGIQGVLAGIEKKRIAKSRAKAATRNAASSFRRAEDVDVAGRQEEVRDLRQEQTILARIESMFAEAGIGAEDVSADVLLAAKAELDLDRLIRRQTAEFARLDLLELGQEFEFEAEDARRASKKAFFGLF